MDLTNSGSASAREAALERAHIVHATLCRNNLFWHNIEPKPGDGHWSDVDAAIDEQLKAGIEPLLVVNGSPSWANQTDPQQDKYFYQIPSEPARFKTWVELYANFAARAARRYHGKVSKWELWNEPNEHFTWKPAPNAEQYAAWYVAVQAAIKSVDPSAQISLGGLTGLSATGPADRQGTLFLKELYDRGLRFDFVSIHPYCGKRSPETILPFQNNFRDVERVRDIMLRYGQQSKKIWLTEWGWSSKEVSEADQAAFVADAIQRTVEHYPYVSLSIYFLDQDRPPEYFFGLFDIANRLKPAGNQFRMALERLHPKPSSIR